jgi:hypothetical protein
MVSPVSYRFAAAATTIYLVLAVAAWSLPFLAKDDDSLAAIFLILAAFPWVIALGFVTDNLGIDSIVFNFAFCFAAILLNAALIYVTLRFLTKRVRAARGLGE